MKKKRGRGHRSPRGWDSPTIFIYYSREENHQVHPTPNSVDTTKQTSNMILEICLLSLSADCPRPLLLGTFNPNTNSCEFYHCMCVSQTKPKGGQYQDSSPATLWFLVHPLLRTPAFHQVTIAVIYLHEPWLSHSPLKSQSWKLLLSFAAGSGNTTLALKALSD